MKNRADFFNRQDVKTLILRVEKLPEMLIKSDCFALQIFY